MDTNKLDRLMESIEKETEHLSSETEIIECYGAGGIVSCKAPAACNEDCYQYKAVMLKATEVWGVDFFHSQNKDRYNDRILMLQRKGIIHN